MYILTRDWHQRKLANTFEVEFAVLWILLFLIIAQARCVLEARAGAVWGRQGETD